MTKQQTTWQVSIEGERTGSYSSHAEAEAVAERIRHDGRRWDEDSIRVVSHVETIRLTVRRGSGWHSSRPDANSTYWARRGYGDGDL